MTPYDTQQLDRPLVGSMIWSVDVTLPSHGTSTVWIIWYGWLKAQ